MNSTEIDVKVHAELHFYARQRLYQHARTIADEAMRKFAVDPIIQVFVAFTQYIQGDLQEAIRTLMPLQNNDDTRLAALIALKDAHSRSKSKDKDAIARLDVDIRQQMPTANERASYYAAVWLYLTGVVDKARPLIDRALKMNAKHAMYLCLKGWIDLVTGRDMKSALKSFDDAISSDISLIDAYLGKARYYEQRHNATSMLDIVKDALGRAPNVIGVHAEMLRALLMHKDWEQAVQTAQRCLVIDADSIDAHVLIAMHALVYQGGAVAQAELMISDIADMVDRVEQRNAPLYTRLVQLFSRSCIGNVTILQICKKLMDKAMSIASTGDHMAELGKLLFMLGHNKQALNVYKQTLQAEDATSAEALIGIIRCYIVDERYDDAQAQLDFVRAANEQLANSVLFIYFDALIGKRKRSKTFQQTIASFQAAIDAHLSSLQSIPFGIDYLLTLDVDFAYVLANELFDFVPASIVPSKSTPDTSLKEIQRLLSIVHDACPGLADIGYLLAKAKYMGGEIEAAQKLLQHCLDRDQTISEAHLLMAQIFVQKGNYKLASQSLDTGLSFNFQVRDHPLYHLIKARIYKRSNQMDAAVQQLQTAIQLPIFKQTTVSEKRDPGAKRNRLELNESDRVAVYLELIDCLQALKRTTEASALMDEALQLWSGRPEQQQLMLSNAELKVERGDVDAALQLLQSIAPDQPNYISARIKIAELYLTHFRDKRQFALTYKQLLEHNPSPQAFVLLGDAYMSIQEPERAIDVYEAAMKRNPKDHLLAQKIGQAYIQSHLYAKAVNYFEAALRSGQQSFLRKDLAELLFRLGNYDKCERVLRQGLERDSTDASSMIDDVTYWSLLSKLHFETGNWQMAVDELGKAKDLQTKILKKSPTEVIDMVEQRKLAAQICCQLAQFHRNQREFTKAIDLYKEALSFGDTDAKIMLSLAQLHLAIGNLDQCNEQCNLLLKIDKDNDQATLMLADLMYQKNEIDQASVHFAQLLERNPNQYHALAKNIELNWRNGDMLQAEKYLKSALDNNPRATIDAGYNYCKGLYEWYSGDPNAALQRFNRARRDLEWGERAIYNMIEICLNPDNEIIGGEVFEHADETTTGVDENEMGTRTAERFLKELRFKPGLDYKYRLMENFILLASKNRANIDLALSNFAQMAGGDITAPANAPIPLSSGQPATAINVGAILGLARGLMMLKAAPKAKIQLKRVLNYRWSLEDADYLEQCWLLLADLYINQGKAEQATNILRTVLQHNASCIKAFEFIGYLREKDQKWQEAAANYEEAWRLTKRRNPTIGYKLGYNYLKAKRLFDAIQVCHRVLQLYPNYPKIRRDVLDKARANVRM